MTPVVYFVFLFLLSISAAFPSVVEGHEGVEALQSTFPGVAENTEAILSYAAIPSYRRVKRSASDHPLQIRAMEQIRRIGHSDPLGSPKKPTDMWSELQESQRSTTDGCTNPETCVARYVPACTSTMRIDLPREGIDVITGKTVRILQAAGMFVQPVIRRLCQSTRPNWGNGECRQRFTAQALVLGNIGLYHTVGLNTTYVFVESHCEFVYDFGSMEKPTAEEDVTTVPSKVLDPELEREFEAEISKGKGQDPKNEVEKIPPVLINPGKSSTRGPRSTDSASRS